MKFFLLFLVVFMLHGCATSTPQVKGAEEGLRRYGLNPHQVLNIEKVVQNFHLDEDTILQIMELTDDQLKRLTQVLKAVEPFTITVNQDMGRFSIGIAVDKDQQAGAQDQTSSATSKTDAKGELKLPLP